MGGDLGEALEVEGAAQVHAELAGLAWDVSPRVPRVGEGIERRVSELGNLSVPAPLISAYHSKTWLIAYIYNVRSEWSC